MTDFGEWDKFVAALSDSDGEGGAAAGEEAGEGRAGAGKAAAPRPKAANGMGNALDRHNARRADAPQECVARRGDSREGPFAARLSAGWRPAR